jgi:type I restriction enzyme S subunit
VRTEAVRLKYLGGTNLRTLPETTDPESTIRYMDIGAVGRGHLLSQPEVIKFGDAPSRARRSVRTGDCIVSTVRTYLRSVTSIRADLDGAVASTGFAVLTPGPRLDARFLGWVAQSEPFIGEIVARSTGVSYPAINASEIGDIEVRVPSHHEQRSIADYLDAETARIDALIASKERMVALLDERRSGIIESTIRDLAATWGERGLRFVASEILVGIVVTPAAFYAERGVLALRGMNVKPGRLDLGDTVMLSAEGHALHRKSVLRAGDVVVVRTGQAGAACVIPADLDGVNCIDVLIVRRSAVLDPRFLEYVLNSDWTAKHIEEHSVGTIQSHFNAGALKQLPIPVPPIEVQRRVTHDLSRAVEQVDELQHRAQRQVLLLAEHRQALITAAVTGEFQVPGEAA